MWPTRKLASLGSFLRIASMGFASHTGAHPALARVACPLWRRARGSDATITTTAWWGVCGGEKLLAQGIEPLSGNWFI